MQRDLDELIESGLAEIPELETTSKSLRKWLGDQFLDTPLRPLKNFLNGTWLEHPLHPVLTDIPIGAWTTAMALDAIALVTGDKKLGKASSMAIGLGIAGAAGAITTGLLDYADTDPPEDQLALTHGIVNIAATALFGASLLMRARSHWKTEPSAVAVAALGFAAVTAGGFLGGSLVFRHGVMVNRNAYRHGPKTYTDAIALKDLVENKPTRVDVNEQPILLVRRGDEVQAICAVCSHYGGPLEKGKLQGDTIECPWHNSVFSLQDGSYRRGPTTAPVPAYDTRVQDGQVQVRLRG